MLCNRCYYPITKSVTAQRYTYGGKQEITGVELGQFSPELKYHLREQ